MHVHLKRKVSMISEAKRLFVVTVNKIMQAYVLMFPYPVKQAGVFLSEGEA